MLVSISISTQNVFFRLKYIKFTQWRTCNPNLLNDLLLSLNFRHSATVDHPGDFVSVLLGELSLASGSSGMQGLFYDSPSVLRHHKLGYHDLHHWALCSHLPHHVVCLQPEGWVLKQNNYTVSCWSWSVLTERWPLHKKNLRDVLNDVYHICPKLSSFGVMFMLKLIWNTILAHSQRIVFK